MTNLPAIRENKQASIIGAVVAVLGLALVIILRRRG